MKWKKFFFLMQGLFLAIDAGQAAWLENVPITLRQPDGREIVCFISGDEYFNWVHDREGYAILKDAASGSYVYGRRAGKILAPTLYRVGEVDPRGAGLVPGMLMEPARLEQSRLAYWAAPQQETRMHPQAAPKSGVLANLVVFIRFSDDPEFTDPIATYENSFNNSAAGANSVHNYFLDISYQQLAVTSHFFPMPGSTVVSYQDAQRRGYYKPVADDPLGYADATERAAREQTLLKNALEAIRSQVPLDLQLDGDGDGLMDNIVFIIYGAPSAWNTLLWPHAWALYQHAVYINGKRAYSYSFQVQSFVGNGSTHVLVHEMLHNIGFPDLYHYGYDGLNPVGVWDVMASPTAPPQHPGAYAKYKYGQWIPDLPLLGSNGRYALNPLSQASGNCFKIVSPAAPGGDQFFVVEYRRRDSSLFESALPGDGLLVYRIDNRDPAHQGNGSLPDEIYVYRPGGTPAVNGNLWAAQFSAGAGRIAINDHTDPAAFLADGSSGDLDLFDVSEASSTISFSLSLTPPAAPLQEAPADEQLNSSLSVLFSWRASPGASSYHLQLANDSVFADLRLDQSGIPLLLWPANSLEPNTTYYWRVSATDSDGDGEWSSLWRFTTLDFPLDSPVLIAPADGAEGQPTTPTLSWSAVSTAASYEVEVDEDASFATPLFARADLLETSVMASGLENERSYFWHVRALNEAGAGPWSELRTFQTDELPVELLSFSATPLAEGIQLEWITATETENYGFDIERRSRSAARAGVWQKVAFVEGHRSSSSKNTYRYLDALREEGTYGYRLKQIDLDGTTAFLSGREATWLQPRAFSLAQNFPNPFNPATSIGYHLDEAGAVTLTVYNNRGQLVRTLANAEQGAGEYQVRWDGLDEQGLPVAGGVYYYTLRCNQQMERRSMLLIR